MDFVRKVIFRGLVSIWRTKLALKNYVHGYTRKNNQEFGALFKGKIFKLWFNLCIINGKGTQNRKEGGGRDFS